MPKAGETGSAQPRVSLPLGYLNMAIQPSLGTNYASAIKILA